jgi:hypothetical protein
MRPERNFGDWNGLCYPVLLSIRFVVYGVTEDGWEAPVVISRAKLCRHDRNLSVKRNKNLRRTPNDRSIFRKYSRGDDAADVSCARLIE